MTKGRKQETKIYKRSFETPQVVGLVGDLEDGELLFLNVFFT